MIDLSVNNKLNKRKLQLSDKDRANLARKRYAVSPQFETKFTNIHSNLKILPNSRPLSPNKDSTIGKTFQYKDIFSSKYAEDTRKEFEYYLETHGGNYKPGFGFSGLFDSESKQGWSKFGSIIKPNPIDENVSRTIKKMKGQK